MRIITWYWNKQTKEWEDERHTTYLQVSPMGKK